MPEESPSSSSVKPSEPSPHWRSNWRIWALALIGPAAAIWIWASALSFVPVPWPDDSAFYFVAKELFHWPPRWVMLPQAPFEPSYRIWNFNTMPLYPILIGLGRFVGIDGSHALKFWPLSFWALSSSVLGVGLYRAGLPALLAAIFAFALAMDPALRWASVLVRPESLIGLCGVILVLGLSLGWFKNTKKEYSVWDPIAGLLAIAAYAHFNAVHLLFAVLPILIFKPRRLVDVGLKATLYLSPWIFTVALRPRLFIQQMTLQWQRLAVGNGWLDSVDSALKSLYQSLGAPQDWPAIILQASRGIWILIFIAFGVFAFSPLRAIYRSIRDESSQPLMQSPDENPAGGITLVPAAGWVIGSVWLWNSKPEVWFTFYIHLAVWTFAGIAALKLWKMWLAFAPSKPFELKFGGPLSALTLLTAGVCGIFVYVNLTQANQFAKTQTWNWATYHEFVDCVDRVLTEDAATAPAGQTFSVWAPTFPDITIELSRKHPDWDLSRTNDFWSRSYLAIQHGFKTDAMVVTEMINSAERDIDAPWPLQHPEVRSVWMDWKGYFLNHFMTAPNWKPKRYLCQKGRWQAFIFMNEKPTLAPASTPASSKASSEALGSH